VLIEVRECALLSSARAQPIRPCAAYPMNLWQERAREERVFRDSLDALVVNIGYVKLISIE
jgi:hypothetical protein